MFDTLESGIGLDIVIWFQDHGNLILFDALAKLIHFCGSPVRLLVVVPFIYWKISRSLAWKFLFALLLSMLSITIFKEIFQAPRPHLAYPDEVHGLVTQNGYGFPSGHVITAVMVSVVIGRWIKRWWMWVIGGVYVVVVGWSRMYAGVHYPQDVLGGLMIGIILAAIYHRLLKRFEVANPESQQYQLPKQNVVGLDRM